MAGMPDFADRLNDLYARVPREGSSTATYSNEAVAEALTQRGIPVTGQYLAQLRSGRKDNPSGRLVGGLAHFFGVPVDYFFDESLAAQVRGQLDQLAALRDSKIQGLMARTHGMSDEGVSSILGIMEHIRHIEGLDHYEALPEEEGRAARGGDGPQAGH